MCAIGGKKRGGNGTGTSVASPVLQSRIGGGFTVRHRPNDSKLGRGGRDVENGQQKRRK